jgi:tetratricopeptide (TPR) repeat protein
MADNNVDITKLEMAFAKDPSSDAFLALSEAYLEQGRFMEAMVVCKKGIKSRDVCVEGEILLARVYSEQGKLKKAADQLKKLLDEHPDSADAHFALGGVHDKNNAEEDAIASWKTALEKDPNHEGARNALTEKGVEVAAAAPAVPAAVDAPAAPAPVEGAPVDGAAAPAPIPGVAAAPAAGAGPAPTPAPQPAVQPTAAPVAATQPAATPRPAAPAPAAGGAGGFAHPAHPGGYDPFAKMMEQNPKRLGFGFTFGLGAIGLVIIVVLVLFLMGRKERVEKIAALTKESTKLVLKDSTSALKKAGERMDQAFELDDEHPKVNAYRAYCYATLASLRGDKEALDKAEKSVENALKVAGDESLTVAAAMLMDLRGGKAPDALAKAKDYKGKEKADRWTDRVFMVEGRAFQTLGQVNGVEEALKKLDRKGVIDPAVLAWVGGAYRSMGQRNKAQISLDAAVRAEPDHGPARATRALFHLETEDLSNLDVALSDVTYLMDLGKESVGNKQRAHAILARAELASLDNRQREFDRDLKEAKRIRARDPEIGLFEGKSLMRNKKAKEAVAAFQEALKYDKFRIQPWLYLIQAAEEARQEDVADKAVTDAGKIFRDSSKLKLFEAETLTRRKKFDEAEKILSALAKKDESAEVLAAMGRLYIGKKDSAKAVETLKKAAKKAEKSISTVRAAVMVDLARALRQAGDRDNALGAVREALKASSRHAPAYYWMGVILVSDKKQRDAARDAFQRYLQMSPAGRYADSAQRALDRF